MRLTCTSLSTMSSAAATCGQQREGGEGFMVAAAQRRFPRCRFCEQSQEELECAGVLMWVWVERESGIYIER